MKDLKIQHMENVLKENSIDFNPDEYCSGEFKRFIKFFTVRELATLRGLNFQQSSDSTFLRNSLKYLYKHNLYVLLSKCVTGRRKRTIEMMDSVVEIPAKEAISPEKMVILQSVFDERIEGISSLDEFEKIERKLRFAGVLAKIINNFTIADAKASGTNKSAAHRYVKENQGTSSKSKSNERNHMEIPMPHTGLFDDDGLAQKKTKTVDGNRQRFDGMTHHSKVIFTELLAIALITFEVILYAVFAKLRY